MATNDPLRLPPNFGKWVGLAAVAGEMFIPILVGAWLDKHYGWNNIGVMVGVIAGFVCGLTHLIVMYKRLSDSNGQSNEKQP